MAEYRYYLIPDAMTRAFPEQFGKQTPTEFFDNIADLEKQGYVLTEEEYQIILEYTIRKSDRRGKGRDYVPLLLEDEIKNYYFRNTVTAISLINMAVA